MARSPRADLAALKTRLIPVLPASGDRAALYTAFLTDLVARCRGLPGARLRVAFTLEGGTAGFADLGLHADELLPQRGGDLGERERHVFDDLFAAGFAHVVLVGSDLPTLPASHLVEAFAELTTPAVPASRVACVVLGASEDGGYYLMGLNARPNHRAPISLFRGIRWSTPFAMADTVAAAAAAGVAVRPIPSWYDVDDGPGLDRLARDLADQSRAADSPETARVLSRLLGRRLTD